MKAIILAAGEGTRLRPYTDEAPKCLVPYRGRPILDYTIDAFKEHGIEDISIVSGYCHHRIDHPKLKKYINPHFKTTNMVSSLFCAEEELTDDVIISYGDIIYSPNNLKNLISDTSPISCVVDHDWLSYWQTRMDNPLDDAESMIIDKNGMIKELGGKTNNQKEIQGQYIGLFKFKKEIIDDIKKFYHSLPQNGLYRGKDKNNMYMTTFLQLIIDNLSPIKPIWIHGNWMEFDSVSDLSLCNMNF